MSNYTKATNFASKDSLLTGNPLKIVKGTEIDNEFNAISTAISTKFDTASLAAPGPIGATTPAAISGTTGTFTGAVSGTTGTFSGNVQMASQNGGQLAGLRNRIINGDMRVAQRGTTGTASGGRSYSLDRWQVGYGGTAPTWAQTSAAIAGVTQLTNFLQVTGTAATSVYMMHRIEASNSRDMAGQTVTLSWYAYQTTGSTMSVTSLMAYATATDNFTSVTTIGTSAATSVPTATMTLVTAQFTIPSAATTGLSISLYANQPSLSGGATINASQVQLEVGPILSPFEQIPYGLSLQLCQRYYYRVYSQTTNGAFSMAQINSATTAAGIVPFPVTMRIPPTALEQSGTASNYRVNSAAANIDCSAAPAYNSATNTNLGYVTYTVASGLTNGFAGSIITNVTTAYLGWSAEL